MIQIPILYSLPDTDPDPDTNFLTRSQSHYLSLYYLYIKLIRLYFNIRNNTYIYIYVYICKYNMYYKLLIIVNSMLSGRSRYYIVIINPLN